MLQEEIFAAAKHGEEAKLKIIGDVFEIGDVDLIESAVYSLHLYFDFSSLIFL